MSITAYTGQPGSGKSYNVMARVILPALKAGRVVCTNLPVRRALDDVYPGAVQRFTTDEIIEDPSRVLEFPRGAVIVFDEAWEIFPQGMNSAKAPQPFLEILKKHRHRVGETGLASEVVLISQDVSDVSRWARANVALTYFHTKLDEVGRDGDFVLDIYRGAVEFDKRSEGKRLDTQYGSYQASVWNLYDSHTEADAGLESERRVRSGGVWRSWRFRGYIIGFLVTVALVWWGMSVVVGAYRDTTSPLQASAEEPVPDPPAPVPVVADPPRFRSPPPEASRPQSSAPVSQAQAVGGSAWRVAGIVYTVEGRQGFALLERQDGRTRQVNLSECSQIEGHREAWRCLVDGAWADPWSGSLRAREFAR